MTRPTILCISMSPIHRDARVLRQIGVLAEHGDVVSVGFGPKPAAVVEHLEVPPGPTLPQTPLGVLKLALHLLSASEMAAPAFRAARSLIGDRRFDLVVANEARALPLAFEVAHGAPVWGDMHEWAPGERDQVRSWRLLVKPLIEHICAKYLAQCAAVTTVSSGIVDEYERVYGVRPELMRNARPYLDLEPSPVSDDGPIRLVHSGTADPSRRLDLLIDAVAAVPNTTLDLYLIRAGDGGKNMAALEKLVTEHPRVTLHPPTEPADLPRVLNAYDVGVFYIPPVNFNMEQGLPNKLFDFVQARLGMVMTPNAEIKRVIEKYELGVVPADFSLAAFTAALAALDPATVRRYKQASDEHARTLSNDTDVAVAHDIVRRLLAGA